MIRWNSGIIAGLKKGKRDNNEDAFLAEKIGDFWVFAVADGLGGHMAGERHCTRLL